jgi:hypothetical protein
MIRSNKISNAVKSLLFLYWILFLSDLLTTYIATPDLKMEGNIWFRLLGVNWWQLIAIYTASVIIVTVGTIVSLNYLNSLFAGSQSIQGSFVFIDLLRNRKLLLSYIFLGMFYSHVMNIGLVVLNNIVGIMYLQGVKGTIGDLATWYVHRQSIFRIFYQSAPILAGYVLAYNRISKFRNDK